MGEVVQLFDKTRSYRGTCLACGKSWDVTPEQLDVAIASEILYSPCCEQPATIVKQKAQ